MTSNFYQQSNSNGQLLTVSRVPLKTKRKTRRSTLSAGKRTSVPAFMDKPAVQRVFLYMQLKNVSNLPVVAYPLELHLYHARNTLQNMSEHYTTETIIHQDEFNMDRPAFALGIIQDDIDDMNSFSDNPLVVTLYQRIPRHLKRELITVDKVRTQVSSWQLTVEKEPEKDLAKKPKETDKAAGDATKEMDTATDGLAPVEPDAFTDEDVEEEDEEYIDECLELVSRGHCDLLQLFQGKRFISNIPIMLYPEYGHKLQTRTAQKITTTSEWHMYSILPILKKTHFTNLVFITLESIYNAPEDLHARATHLGMSISIRSTKPVLNDQYEMLPLCTFYGFGSQIINEQNIVVVWENIKRDLLGKAPLGVANVQMETNLRIKMHRLFRQLLMTQGVDFKLEQIDTAADSALINNSLHRYVLTKQMQEILEAAVVHNHYELLLQLYDEIPLNVMYEGVINPSVFGYPEVNACRFAAQLSSVNKKTTRKTFRPSEGSSPELPMFAIVNLCFFQPLTKRNEPLDAYNESDLKSAKLRRCTAVDFQNEDDNARDILKELYRNFDEHIKELISFIIKNDVTSIEERHSYFCCNLSNLRNLLVDICGCDFNVRMPTKTNIEFREMLTHMHKELMERIYGLLNGCGWESISNCVLNQDNDQPRMRRLMEEYRNLCIIGDCVLAKQLFTELNAACTNHMLLNFYVFLNSVESLNFEHATNYLQTQKEHNWQGEYFVNLLKLYIDYEVQLKSEELPGEAYSNMIEKLRAFASNNNLDREAWVLLYCFYKQKNYLPGMEFTRWKYENLYDVPGRTMPLIPRSLFETFMPDHFNVFAKSVHIVKFYDVFQTFARLGAYGFAEAVFNEIAHEFSTIEVYLVNTTLKMLQGEIDNQFKVRTLPTDNSERGHMMRFYQAHINGNVEYSRRNYDEAIKYFKDLLNIDLTDTDILSVFYPSLLRLARLSFERGDFELSMKAYEMCVPSSKKEKNFLANYGMGLSLYYLNRLEDAIVYLARSTEVDIFLPDPWGYLAIINLRLDRNKTALDCWKIAKKYPEMPLNGRIYTELEKIKYSDVCLLVEDNCKPA
ncbi:uncharacterized protein LOC135429228 [Drosophila montana]|uniref:uncharacterized protein LOC135429228 n=1 Tax=Drosophila montana TaxID=40370 RepID=UPI00313BF7C2